MGDGRRRGKEEGTKKTMAPKKRVQLEREAERELELQTRVAGDGHEGKGEGYLDGLVVGGGGDLVAARGERAGEHEPIVPLQRRGQAHEANHPPPPPISAHSRL